VRDMFRTFLEIILTDCLAEKFLVEIPNNQLPMAICSTIPELLAPALKGGKKQKGSKKRKDANTFMEQRLPETTIKDKPSKLEPYTRAYIDKEPVPKDSVNPATYIRTPIDPQPRIPISARSAEVQATMVSNPLALNKNVVLPHILLGGSDEARTAVSTEMSSCPRVYENTQFGTQNTSKPPSATFPAKNIVVKQALDSTISSTQKRPISIVANRFAPFQEVAQPEHVASITVSTSVCEDAASTDNSKTAMTSNPTSSSAISGSYLITEPHVVGAFSDLDDRKETITGEQSDSDEYEYESESSEVEIIVDRDQPRKGKGPTLPAVEKGCPVKAGNSVIKKQADVSKAQADTQEVHDGKKARTSAIAVKFAEDRIDKRENFRNYEEYSGYYEEENWDDEDYDGDHDEDEYDQGAHEQADYDKHEFLKPEAHKERASPITPANEKPMNQDQQNICTSGIASVNDKSKGIIEEALEDDSKLGKDTSPKIKAVILARHTSKTSQPDNTIIHPEISEIKKVDEGELWYDPDVPANIGVNHISSDEEYSGGVLRSRKITTFKARDFRFLAPKSTTAKIGSHRTQFFRSPAQQ